LADSELYRTHHHWGARAFDIYGQNLPALKARFLIENLPADGRVLEVGCGSGKILNTVAANRPALELHGCDIRPLSAQSEVFEFKLVAPDSAELPFEPGSFDAVLMSDILEHLRNPAVTLRATAQVLRPGGRLVVFSPLEGQRFSFYRGYRKLLGDDLYIHTKEHIQAYSDASLRALIDAQFEVVKQQYAYHLVGHLMDATLFAAMKLPTLERMFWSENPYYAEEEPASQAELSLYARALRVANRLAFAESRALSTTGVGAAGTLLVAQKR
jgi:SAM-dependent methyltransferase